jgi:AAA domain
MTTTYKAVNGARRCPVCDGKHKCSIGDDKSIQCGRVPDGLKPGAEHNGFVFMKVGKDPQFGTFRAVDDPVLRERNEERQREWERHHRRSGNGTMHNDEDGVQDRPDMESRAKALAANLTADLAAELAEVLGLPESVISFLPNIGYSPTGFHKDRQPDACWTFPETNGAGRITGIVCRYADGSKPSMAGSGRGIYVPTGWREREGPIFLGEGASDVLAMTALGLAALGRPNNRAGVEQLREVLADVPADRAIVVLGEYDPKPNGTWPGRDGMLETAAALARGLKRPVCWSFPPDGKKDVRRWVLDQRPDPSVTDEWQELGDRLREALVGGMKTVEYSAASSIAAAESFTAEDLLGMELPEPCYAVEGVIPEGMCVLAGKPKLGKSWMALNLGIAVSEGGTALNAIDVEAGDILYLALEDTKRRLKGRLQKLLSAQQGRTPSRLTLVTRCPRQGAGGIEYLEEWIRAHPGARLIVIDTWPKFRPTKSRGRDSYEEDYEHAAALKALADRHGIAILVIAHCRKMDAEDPVDSVSGTLGLTGAADAVLVLKRERGQHDATLFITGRDIEEKELALRWDGKYALWSIVGEAAQYRMTKDRTDVLALLQKEGPLSPTEAAGFLDKTPNAVKMLLRKLEREQWVKGNAGRYAVTRLDTPDTPDTLWKGDDASG